MDEQPETMVSESMSVSTTFMDTLSSIFSLRAAPAKQEAPPQLKQSDA